MLCESRFLANVSIILKPCRIQRRCASTAPTSPNPRAGDIGRRIENDYAAIRERYETPKNAIVLAHGLMGFDELRIAGRLLPGIKYWRGIAEALAANGIEVITTSVSAVGSVEQRAEMLSRAIEKRAYGKSVNIIAHSMGGLDARYMISRIHPPNVNVVSLSTIATPHHGSSFADYIFERIGRRNIPRVYKAMDKLGLEHGAYSQLTREYMCDEFNPKTPDDPSVRYFSYGAMCNPGWWSMFWTPHRIINRVEGENDGLVSVESSQWGSYKGTLVGVNHLDLINWTNRLRWMIWELTGNKRNFNAVAFYLSVADMLAKEGL